MRKNMHDAIVKGIWDETEDHRIINTKNSADWIAREKNPFSKEIFIHIGPINAEGAHNFGLTFIEDFSMSPDDEYISDANNIVRGRSFSINKLEGYINNLIRRSEKHIFLDICKYLSNYIYWEYEGYQ
jgi:hypothetical protein